ncbi:putative hydrolase of the HAD superfamily [Labedaea rhizosphaerae]|uniref:Putative hydrolase of the HAD superfamily n=1 Tax=Labedaea rhizosphaerae TaxID=598644 RepID=A0A4R6SDJ8_LABRH|nr:HAD family hydrolase [Labedaea rhizosphaerae]TDP97754.1 putative hydrolase of the HAD superfamily [Labedaea rhizosphaerae]
MPSPFAPRPATPAPTATAQARPCPLLSGLPALNAVCLDIDDTLIDFTASARTALHGMIGRDDLWPRWQQLTDEFVRRVVAGDLDYQQMRCARTKAFFADLGNHLADDEVDAMEQRRLSEMNRAWTLFEDALPCLDWLRAAGLAIAAVTNASGPHQHAKLADTGLTRFFDAVLIAGECGVAKPDPGIFHAACAQLGTTPATTAHVGDRCDVDAHGARNAGLHGIWLDRSGAGVATARAEGLLAITGLDELPELLVSEYRLGPAGGASPVPAPR